MHIASSCVPQQTQFGLMIQIYSSEYSSTSGKYLVTHWPQDLCPDSGQFAWLVTQAMLNIVNSSEMYVMCFVDRTFWKLKIHCICTAWTVHSIFLLTFFREKFKLLKVLALIYYALRCCSELIRCIKSFAIKCSNDFYSPLDIACTQKHRFVHRTASDVQSGI